MRLLIDGYNLIHKGGLLPRHTGPGGLERARARLLGLLAGSLTEAERGRTVIVFDACAAPPDVPATLLHNGLSVRFAVGYENADALLEELIRQASHPRQLVVVTSDHRVQRAARRCGARFVESAPWLDGLLQQRAQRNQRNADEEKPAAPHSDDVAHWLKVFGCQVDEGSATLPESTGTRPRAAAAQVAAQTPRPPAAGK
jgi:hypothetical protein